MCHDDRMQSIQEYYADPSEISSVFFKPMPSRVLSNVPFEPHSNYDDIILNDGSSVFFKPMPSRALSNVPF